jgi:hypothetical protein
VLPQERLTERGEIVLPFYQAVAELLDELVDRGLAPQRFARLWIHTHPGESPLSSGTDEETLARTFETCDGGEPNLLLPPPPFLARAGGHSLRGLKSAGIGLDRAHRAGLVQANPLAGHQLFCGGGILLGAEVVHFHLPLEDVDFLAVEATRSKRARN